MQAMLFNGNYGMTRSVITPLRYPGNKARPADYLCRRVPPGTREIVSPFLGGGAFELRLTGRNVQVYGYDAFPPLANFWEELLKNPDALCNRVIQFFREMSFEEMREFKRGGYADLTSSLEQAAMFIILFNCGWDGVGFRPTGMTRFVLDEHEQPRMNYESANGVLIHYDRIRGFNNEFINVGCADFRDSLQQHSELFAYCDPPYPECGGLYGDKREYHEDFPHQELAKILRSRENWMLSYNDCELVRELYPNSDFLWEHLVWNQTSRRKQSRRGNDVLISPKK